MPELSPKTPEWAQKVILFDPTEIYSRITIDPYKRWQSLSVTSTFPNFDHIDAGKCACGCGNNLTGRQKRWSDPEHGKFPWNVTRIINGDMQFVRGLMHWYLPEQCAICGKEPYLLESETEHTSFNGFKYKTYFSANGIHVDHIIPVKKGGAGCWLGNFQFLCHVCNLRKGDNTPAPKPLPISSLFT
ncbi:MAG: HNH endonuclease [Mucilaginibacter sp.]